MTERPEQRATAHAARWRGLRAHSAAERQRTVTRLADAIALLRAQGQAITADTIKAASGLAYSTITRNVAAHDLFRANSTCLTATGRRRSRARAASETPVSGRDRVSTYKRAELEARLRMALQRIQTLEEQNARLLTERVECDLALMRLEAQLADYRDFLGKLRTQAQAEEQRP